jgi:uncharacterized Zn ribbon protein
MSNDIYYDDDRNVIPMPSEEWKIHLAEKETEGKVFDAYGTELLAGDTIISIKPLPVKKGVDLKQGEKFTRIKLTEDTGMVIAKHEKNGEMYLKTEFFKKA